MTAKPAKPFSYFIFFILFLFLSLQISFAGLSTSSQYTLSLNTEPSDVSIASVLNTSQKTIIVAINGRETFLLDDATGQPITDKVKIATLLDEHLRTTKNYSQTIDLAVSTLTSFDASKAARESLCKRITGLYTGPEDSTPCNDKVSCIVSCSAVQMCAGVVYAAGIVESIMEYRDDLAAYNSSFENFKGSMQSAKADGTRLTEAAQAFNSYKAAVSGINSNRLLTNCSDCFDYCRHYNWSMARLTAVERNLTYVISIQNSSTALPVRSDAILNSTNALLAYSSQRPEIKSGLQSRLKKMGNELNNSIEWLAKRMGVAELGRNYARYQNLSNVTNAMIMRGDVRLAIVNEPILGRLNATILAEVGKRKLLLQQVDNLTARIGEKISKVSNKTAAGNAEFIGILSYYNSLKNRTAATYDSLSAKKSELEAVNNRLNEWMVANGAGSSSAGTGGALGGITANLPVQCPIAFVIMSAAVIGLTLGYVRIINPAKKY